MDSGKRFLQIAFGARDDNFWRLGVIGGWWILVGAILALAGTAVAIAHYRFGVTIHQRHSQALADPYKLFWTFAGMIGIGTFFVLSGWWIRRVCDRWYDSE
jgi:hypothetical protein